MAKVCYLRIYDDTPTTKGLLERAGVAIRRMGSNILIPAREGRRGYGVSCSWQENDRGARIEALLVDLEASGRVKRGP
jgi:hypothetical protein